MSADQNHFQKGIAMYRLLVVSLVLLAAGCCDKCKQKPTCQTEKTACGDTVTTVEPTGVEAVRYHDGDNVRSSNDQTYRSSGDQVAGAPGDQAFLRDASQGNLTEIENARLALKSAASDEVRRYAQRILDDHTRNQSDLRGVAQKAGVDLPNDIDSHHHDMQTQLTRLSGSDFDREYIRMMISDHQKDISKFEDAARNSKDSEVRDFASKTLPTLRDHLKSARDINDRLKNRRT